MRITNTEQSVTVSDYVQACTKASGTSREDYLQRIQCKKHIKELLPQINIAKEELHVLLQLFLDPCFDDNDWEKCELFYQLQRQAKDVNLHVMAQTLGEDEALWRKILYARELRPGQNESDGLPLLKVYFPVANYTASVMEEAWVIPLPGEGVPLYFGASYRKQGLTEIQQAMRCVAPESSHRYFVIFRNYFTDDSYMLSVAAALLLPPAKLASYSFSGRVEENGDVFGVGYIEPKELSSKSADLRLVTAEHVRSLEALDYWLGDGPIDIPILQLANKPHREVLRSLERLESAIRKSSRHQKRHFFRLKTLQALFGLNESDLTIMHEGFLESDTAYWQEYLDQKVRPQLEQLATSFPHRKRVFHVACSIATLAFGMGVIFGMQKPMVVYHYQGDLYHPILDLDETNLRTPKTVLPDQQDLQYVTVQGEETADHQVVGIYLASHNPAGDMKHFVNATLPDAKTTHIQIKSDPQGNIPLDPPDWSPYISELYSILNHLKANGAGILHIFLSMPVAMAFGLGMACGHFFQANVYNYNPQAQGVPENLYYKVFSPGELPSTL